MRVESPKLPERGRMSKMISRKTVVTLFVLLWALPSGGFAVGNYTVTKKVVEGHTTYHLVDVKRKMDVECADKEGHSWQKQNGIQLPVKTT